MANNLTLSVTLTGDNRQLSGTLKDAQGDVREFSTTTERESKKAETALEAPGRQAGTVSEHLRGAQREARTFGTETVQGGRQATQALAQTGDQAQTVTGHLDQMRTMAIGLGVAFTAMGIQGFINDTYEAVRSSQQLQASLRTVTGSVENATAAWDQLLVFAAETPFTLDQSVQAFIRMQALGLNPTQEALRSFGNTAAAMGEDMMRMVEAVADATTGEFERLKAFGIRSAVEGDQIAFTFQGVTTRIRNSAADISAYLQSIGEIQFAGAMADQMATLSGQSANLEDSIYQLYLAIGEAGATQAFENALSGASNTVQFLTDNIDALASGAEIMAVLLGGRVAVALATVTAAKLAATQQTIAYQLALARMAGVSTTAAAGQVALAGATRAASGALALVGGPLGAAMLAGGAIYYFREELGLVTPTVQSATDRVDDMTSALDANSEAALKNARAMLEAEQQFQQFRQATLAMDVSRQRQIVADEQRQWDAVGGQAAFGMGQRSESQQALNDLQIELMNTRNAIDAAGGSVTEIDEKLAQLERTTRETITPTTDLGDASTTTAAASREAAAAANELTKSTEAQASALEDLRNRLIPGRREVVQLAQDMQTLTLAMAMGTGNVAENIQMIGLLQQQYIEAQNDTDDLAAKTVDAAFTMEGAWDELRLNGLRRLDDGFADLWQSAIDGSQNAGDIMKRALDQTLAELAHMAITRPITVQIATSMGFGGGGAGGQQSAGGGFGMNPMSFGGAGQAFGNAFRAFQGTGSTYAGTFGSELAVQTQGGLQAGFDSFAASNFGGAALGIGGGLAGGWASGAVFGESQEQQIGSTLGGLAGQVLIPIPGVGAAIGSFIGGGLGSLASHTPTSFDGEFVTRDSSVDMSGMSREERVNTTRAQSGNSQFYYGGFNTQSAFGSVGFGAGTTRLHRADGGPMDDSDLHQRAEWGWELSENAAQLDNYVASLASSTEQLGVMRDAVQALSIRSGDAAEIIQFALVDRSLAALDAAGIAVSERFRHMGADTFAAELQLAVAAVNTLGGASSRLNLQFDAASDGALLAADNIAQYVGGLDNLSALQSQYYQAFFTEEERLAHLTEDLTAQFSAMGMALPDTRQGVRDVVESLELMGASGQQQLATVLQLNQPLAQYIAAMEEQRAAAAAAGEAVDDSADSMRALADIARERETLEMQLLRAQGNTAEIRRRELAGIDESNRGIQTHIYAINDMESAYRDFTNSLNAERQILQAAHRETTSSIQRNMQTVQAAMQRAEQASQSLNSALQQTQSGTLYAREQGQAALRAMLEAGEISDQRDLDNALAAVAEPSEGLFATFLDYQRDQARTGHTIKDLEQLAGEQLTSEERSLQALENQLAQADRQFDQEMARLDNMLAAQDALIEAEYGQLNWLETVNNSVLSLQDALAALGAARNTGGSSSRIGQGGTGAGGSVTDADINWTIDQVRDSAGGINDAAARKLYEAALNTGTPLDRIEQQIPGAIDWVERAGLPKFRDGGISDGPTSGYLAELHGPEAVVPLPNGRSIPVEMRGPALGAQSSDNGMLRAMNTLIKRVESLEKELATHKPIHRATEENTKKLAKEALRSRLKEGVEE